MLERALELDAKFAAARAEYALTHVLMIFRGDSNDPDWLYKAEQEIRQALQDDPTCGRAHAVLAATYLLRGRKELVSAELDKALKANPDDRTAYSWLLLYHHINGDHEQASELAMKSTARWPLFWPVRLSLGELLREHGDTVGAVREQQRILEHDSRNLMAILSLSRAYIDAGDLPKARQTLERSRREDRQNYSLRLYEAVLLALEGERARALKEMDAGLQAYAAGQIYGPLRAAEFYAVTGDTAKALEWLERAVRMGDDREDWLRRDPLLAGIREHPQFQQMLASIAYRRQQRRSAN
jgi:tetratricopeptide (TPR) repeat protein